MLVLALCLVIYSLWQRVSLNKQSTVITAHVCVCIIVHNHDTQHRTVLIIFPLILRTVIIAHMSTGEERRGYLKIYLKHYKI